MKIKSNNIKKKKVCLKPLFFALNTILAGAALLQVPIASHAALASKPAGAGVAIIAVTSATSSSTNDLINAAAALKAKGYEVKFALPSNSSSSSTIATIASSGGYSTISGSSAQIAASLPNAVAYGDGAAVNIASSLAGQKTDSNGAYDINGNLTGINGASSASVLSTTQKSTAALTGSVPQNPKTPLIRLYSK